MKNFRMTRAVCALLAAAALGAGMAGCVPLVIGGAAIGGMKTNMSGKLSLSVELSEGKAVEVKVIRK